MGFLPQEPYRRTVYIIFYSLLGILAVYVAAEYVVPVILPFLLAFAAASLASALLPPPYPKRPKSRRRSFLWSLSFCF